jgi:hypothetical protein
MHNFKAITYGLSAVLAGMFAINSAHAQQGDMLKEYTLAPNAFAADRNHNLIYVSLTSSNSVTIWT